MVVDIPAILVGVSWLARWLFERVGGDARTAMIILLLVVVIGAGTTELIHLEGIIGAFLAGFEARLATP